MLLNQILIISIFSNQSISIKILIQILILINIRCSGMIYWTFEFGDGTGPSGARMDNGLITVHFTCLAALQIPAPCHAFSYFDGPWVHGWKQINKVKGHSTYRSRIHILKFILTNLMSVWPVAVGPSESESWVVSLTSLPVLWMHIIFRFSD